MKRLSRFQEINMIISYLEKNTLEWAETEFFAEQIVENGKIIEEYQNELKLIKENKK